MICCKEIQRHRLRDREMWWAAELINCSEALNARLVASGNLGHTHRPGQDVFSTLPNKLLVTLTGVIYSRSRGLCNFYNQV